MFTLSARDQIEGEGSASELAGGSVEIPTQSPSNSSRNARRKKKR
jgi:hypothetical protein